MPDHIPIPPVDATHEQLTTYRIHVNTERVSVALEMGDIERASYYADRVLVLVGKAITEEPKP